LVAPFVLEVGSGIAGSERSILKSLPGI